jgi:hypothetical protein
MNHGKPFDSMINPIMLWACLLCGVDCYAEPAVASPVNLLCCRLFTPHKGASLERGDQFVGRLETS